jgi:hypothetical protein
MPTIYLKDDGDSIQIVVVNGEKYLNTYIHARKHINAKFKVLALPNNKYLGMVMLGALVLLIKIFKWEIVIFHEACWPILDIFIELIKPIGKFVPMTTLNGFTKLNEDQSNKYIEQRIKIKWISKRLKNIFQIYTHRADNGIDLAYDWSIKKYPNSIEKMYENYIVNRIKIEVTNTFRSKSILFLVGTEPIDPQILHELYGKIIEFLWINDIPYKIKDHPLKHGRLYLKNQDYYSYEPEIAADFIFDEHEISIGCASTALCTFPGKKISIINLIDTWDHADKLERLAYIKHLNQEIFMPSNFLELKDWLKKWMNEHSSDLR